jgi:hypothetical protein
MGKMKYSVTKELAKRRSMGILSGLKWCNDCKVGKKM